jgi:hypothetical protein
MNEATLNPFEQAGMGLLKNTTHELVMRESHSVDSLGCKVDDETLEHGGYWLIDGPGITGMGYNWLAKMQAHAERGGSFVHYVRPDGTLVHPERMWPGQALDGKRVTKSGKVLEQ